MTIIPKPEAMPAVISSPNKAKACLLCESEEIIISLVIVALLTCVCAFVNLSAFCSKLLLNHVNALSI